MKMACLSVFNFRRGVKCSDQAMAWKSPSSNHDSQENSQETQILASRQNPGGESGPASPSLRAELEHSQYQYISCLTLSLCWLVFCKALYKPGWNPISISCLGLPQGPCSLLHQIFPNTASTRSWGGVGKACSSEVIFSSLMIMIWLMPLRNSWECFHIASFPAVF